MCNGYWETCNCIECEKAKELYDDLNFYWENKKRIEEVERELENRALEITEILDKLNYELKISLLNDRLLDAEGIEIEIEELENELMAMGY